MRIQISSSYHFTSHQPAGAMANTASGAPAQEKPRSPASITRSKVRAKKGKGKGKAKPEPPEETDPRKLELIRWVRMAFLENTLWKIKKINGRKEDVH